MRCFILGFLSGCYYLHQQAALFVWWQCLLLILAGIAVYCLGRCAALCLPKSKQQIKLTGFVVCGAIAGMLWTNGYACSLLMHQLPHHLEKKDITVTGQVDDLPSEDKNRVRFILKIDTACDQHQRLAVFPERIQLVWYTKNRFSNDTYPHEKVKPGQKWRLVVRLKRPHGLVNPYKKDSEINLLEKHIQATGYVQARRNPQLLTPFVFSVTHAVHSVRARLKDKLHQYLPSAPYRGILTALIIGDQSEIASSTWDVFRQTGISHLVAISGMHVTLVAGFLSALFERGWRRSFWTQRALPLWLPAQKARLCCAVCIAAVYVVLAGLGIPAQRAFIMLLVTACGVMCARHIAPSQLLLLALFIIVLTDPWALYSPGCWLSFGAVAILFYGGGQRRYVHKTDLHKPSNQRWRFLKKIVRHSHQYGMTQYVLLLGLLPLSVAAFGQYAFISPLTNAMAIPVVTLLVVPCGLLGAVMPHTAASFVWSLGHAILAYLMQSMAWFAKIDWGMHYFTVPDKITTLMAIGGIAVLLLPSGFSYRFVGWLGLLPFVFYPTKQPDQNDLWLTVLDVGQGMSVLVETAQHRLLYDTGAKFGDDTDAGSAVIAPYLQARGIKYIDVMMISHQDTDHAGGAQSLFQLLSFGEMLSSLPVSHTLHQAVKRTHPCEAGQHWVWDGVVFDVLHPLKSDYAQPQRRPNAMSCVLSIRAHGRRILLTGDIGKKQEKAILKRYTPQALQAWGITAPHHGSKTSSSLPFLQTVQPAWAVFQVGYLNQFHHPHPQILQRYHALNIQPFRSDKEGAIEIKITAQHQTISSVKQQIPHYWYE